MLPTIVKIWNEDKFLFSFYFCLFSFSNGIIKTGKSKKKIEICFHSKCRLYFKTFINIPNICLKYWLSTKTNN